MLLKPLTTASTWSWSVKKKQCLWIILYEVLYLLFAIGHNLLIVENGKVWFQWKFSGEVQAFCANIEWGTKLQEAVFVGWPVLRKFVRPYPLYLWKVWWLHFYLLEGLRFVAFVVESKCQAGRYKLLRKTLLDLLRSRFCKLPVW